MRTSVDRNSFVSFRRKSATTAHVCASMNRVSLSSAGTIRCVSGRARGAGRATRVVRNSRSDDAAGSNVEGNDIETQIARTIGRIRDAEDDGRFSHATLLTLAMQLSLECELTAAGSSPPASVTSNVSRATWTLQRIKGMADQARRLFLEAVKEDGLAGEELASDRGRGYSERVSRNPLSLIEAISSVFLEQGYRKMNSWADLQAFSFAQVVEGGAGSPLTIAILYQAIAIECGLALDLIVLEEGNYAVLSMGMWVIDPYSKCLLMSAEEVAELFDVDLPLRPSSLREVSIALVKQRLFFEWSSITGVYEPAFRLPLDGEEGLDLALGCFEDVSFSYSSADERGERGERGERDEGAEADEAAEGSISPFFLVQDERGQECLAHCVRAAEKLRVLERNDPPSRIRHAVLLYVLNPVLSLV